MSHISIYPSTPVLPLYHYVFFIFYSSYLFFLTFFLYSALNCAFNYFTILHILESLAGFHGTLCFTMFTLSVMSQLSIFHYTYTPSLLSSFASLLPFPSPFGVSCITTSICSPSLTLSFKSPLALHPVFVWLPCCVLTQFGGDSQ